MRWTHCSFSKAATAAELLVVKLDFVEYHASFRMRMDSFVNSQYESIGLYHFLYFVSTRITLRIVFYCFAMSKILPSPIACPSTAARHFRKKRFDLPIEPTHVPSPSTSSAGPPP